jgi:hypothetical protein
LCSFFWHGKYTSSIRLSNSHYLRFLSILGRQVNYLFSQMRRKMVFFSVWVKQLWIVHDTNAVSK